MGAAQYSPEFKKAAVQKLLSRGNRTAEEVARQIGVSSFSLYLWTKQLGKGPETVTTDRKPSTLSAQEKLQAILDYRATAEPERGAWLRQNGLTSETLDLWSAAIEEALQGNKPPPRIRELERANQKLERQLLRKDKALAEAAALIILQKKVSALFASEDES
jgi:transposase